MDSLRLQKYNRQGSLIDKDINSLDKISRKGMHVSGNTKLTDKGLIKSEKQFLEYFINDKPLSELLDNFYNSKTTILENRTGALGSNPKNRSYQSKTTSSKENFRHRNKASISFGMD
ncbi:hypothetical protein ESA94_03410 [Lacibacter luteus]|uniref:Uncharacterized protein n=1 Tax=Lacibacter luteus TaxID=2508719 RepID=A0A4V1M7Z5_9BACT|nr:hypothetical protein [Lacibacter luteus]RXK62072.1 hypothetical protein ESA94_03410 [Lacibacter luteus]